VLRRSTVAARSADFNAVLMDSNASADITQLWLMLSKIDSRHATCTGTNNTVEYYFAPSIADDTQYITTVGQMFSGFIKHNPIVSLVGRNCPLKVTGEIRHLINWEWSIFTQLNSGFSNRIRARRVRAFRCIQSENEICHL
jgi:hypothetical protein